MPDDDAAPVDHADMTDVTPDVQPQAKGGGHPWRQAAGTWMSYAEGTESLVHLTHEGLARVIQMPEMHRTLEGALGSSDPQEYEAKLARAVWKADQARAEVEAGFPTLHAHSLLGLWGALECFIEDVFLACIDNEPGLLASESFAKIKLPVATAFATDHAERDAAILLATSQAVGGDLGQGVGRFERLLGTVGFSGSVPEKVATAIYEAQQIRNVWAHRGGLADRRFIDACPHLGFAHGQRVNVDGDLFMRLMHGMHMYGVVVLNRGLLSVGREPIAAACPGYESSVEGTALGTGGVTQPGT